MPHTTTVTTLCHQNAKGNKCQAGHRHNGTAITLAVTASLAKHSRPELRSHVAFWPEAAVRCPAAIRQQLGV
jgi:hypothetical protein